MTSPQPRSRSRWFAVATLLVGAGLATLLVLFLVPVTAVGVGRYLSVPERGFLSAEEAEVARWGGDGVLHAVLERVEPSARTKVSALGIEEQRVDAIFELTTPLEDRPGLGDGFSVYVHIIEWQADDTLQVPISAVFRRGQDWAVFRAIDGIAEERPVTLGRRNSRTVQVLDGLEEGDAVILHPSDSISAGTTIQTRTTQ